MDGLKELSIEKLVSMLSEQTAQLTKLFADKYHSEEYKKCKLKIMAIQAEIDSRKGGDHNSNSPDFL